MPLTHPIPIKAVLRPFFPQLQLVASNALENLLWVRWDAGHVTGIRFLLPLLWLDRLTCKPAPPRLVALQTHKGQDHLVRGFAGEHEGSLNNLNYGAGSWANMHSQEHWTSASFMTHLNPHCCYYSDKKKTT